MRKIKVTYYLPSQSELFSNPKVAIIDDDNTHRELIEHCRENGYKILSVETIEQ